MTQQQAVNAFNELVAAIMEYESDTFSAMYSKVTETEASAIAARLIGYLTDTCLDGVQLDAFLMDIRESTNEGEGQL